MRSEITLKVIIEIEEETGDSIEALDDLTWKIEDAIANTISAGVASGLFPGNISVSPQIETKITEWA